MTEVTLLVASWCPVCPLARALWSKLAESHAFHIEEVDISTRRGRDLAMQQPP